ncbi:hypothetical protein J6590_084490 [Homalodisca vitripennis]|nr:hypothetical protein J6590_084490 [Homalodisca vitripennis]
MMIFHTETLPTAYCLAWSSCRRSMDLHVRMYTLTSERQKELTDSATSISGVCMPGARLLDIIKLNQSSPGPGPRCEVMIAGTNYLADLDPYLYVHDDTFLVNSYIKELSDRCNARFFTRHGHYLTMRGKRLLARMIWRVASLKPLKTANTPDLAILTVTSSPTITQEPAAVTPQHQYSGRLQHISYAEAVKKYPVLD